MTAHVDLSLVASRTPHSRVWNYAPEVGLALLLLVIGTAGLVAPSWHGNGSIRGSISISCLDYFYVAGLSSDFNGACEYRRASYPPMFADYPVNYRASCIACYMASWA